MTRFIPASFIALCVVAGSCGLPGVGSPGGTNNGTYWSKGSGTLMGSTVNATITNAEVFFEHVSSGSTSISEFEIVLEDGSSTTTPGAVTFTMPAGATSSSFVSSISLSQLPTSGTFTSTGNQACGGVEIEESSGSNVVPWAAESSSACGSDAGSSAATAVGTWTLNLTSATEFDGATDIAASVAYYTVHGSLLDLTF